MGSTDIFVAKETFTVTYDGAPIVIHKGQTRVRAGHPLLVGREAFFEPLNVQYDLEQATAAPGETRGEAAGRGPGGRFQPRPAEPTPEPTKEPAPPEPTPEPDLKAKA